MRPQDLRPGASRNTCSSTGASPAHASRAGGARSPREGPRSANPVAPEGTRPRSTLRGLSAGGSRSDWRGQSFLVVCSSLLATREPMYIGRYVAEETPEYTTTRRDALERHEIIVLEFVQRTFSPQQLGLRALLGLLRAGTSLSQLHEATLRHSVSTPPLSASTPSTFTPPLLRFLPHPPPLPCWDPSAASQSYSPSF